MNYSTPDWRMRAGTRVHVDHIRRGIVTWCAVPKPFRKYKNTVQEFRRLVPYRVPM